MPHLKTHMLALIGLLAASLLAGPPASSAQSIDGIGRLGEPNELSQRVIIVGEWHGTEQAPAFVGDLALHYADRGVRVGVVLEQPDGMNAAYAAAGAGVQGRRAYCDVLDREMGLNRDGRSSGALADLAVRLSSAARGGAAVSMFGMDLSEPIPEEIGVAPITYRRDYNAANIASYAELVDLAIVLVGNNHPPALKRRLEEQYGLETATLGMMWGAGEAWNCQRGRCEVHSTDGNLAYLDSIPEQAPAILPGAGRRHDHRVYLGPLTASPPALRSGWCGGDNPPARANP